MGVDGCQQDIENEFKAVENSLLSLFDGIGFDQVFM
jgi:hypothetical protein